MLKENSRNISSTAVRSIKKSKYEKRGDVWNLIRDVPVVIAVPSDGAVTDFDGSDILQ